MGQPEDQHRRRHLHEPEPAAAPSRERVRRHRATASSTSGRRHHAQPQRADAVQLQQPPARARASRVSGLLGNAVSDYKSTVDGAEGVRLPRPELRLGQQHEPESDRTTISQRRLVSALRPGDARLQQLPVPDGHGPQRLDVDDSRRSGTRSSIRRSRRASSSPTRSRRSAVT